MSDEILNTERAAFWAALSLAAPDLGIEASPGWEKELPLPGDARLKFKISLSQDKTSVYLFTRAPEMRGWIEAHLDALARGLRTTPGAATGQAAQGRFFRKDNAKACFTVRRQWPEAIRWLRAQHLTFSQAVATVWSETAPLPLLTPARPTQPEENGQ
ncbi:MAG: hypothetical protein ACXIU7_11610 [Roseinatronobacter sp.]